MTATGPNTIGKKLLVVIPCLNEERTVGDVVRRIPRDMPGVAFIKVLVIDDGSSDATSERAREAGAAVSTFNVNRGLGVAFRHAVEVAISWPADIMVNIDGDGQFDPRDIPELIAPVVRDEADMTTASRFSRSEFVPDMPAVKRWGNAAVARIVRVLSGASFRDVSCGFRAFSNEALLRMNLFGSFTYTQECFLDLVFKGLTILEIPVRVRGTREFGTSRVASSLPRYAWRTLEIMLRAFLSYRPLRFFAAIALPFLSAGLGFLSFLGIHYVRTDAFTPYIWTGFVGGSLCFVGILTLVIGFLGDMLVRIRLNQELILYTLKRARPLPPLDEPVPTSHPRASDQPLVDARAVRPAGEAQARRGTPASDD